MAAGTEAPGGSAGGPLLVVDNTASGLTAA